MERGWVLFKYLSFCLIFNKEKNNFRMKVMASDGYLLLNLMKQILACLMK